eukprot:g955.t1
MSFFKPSHAPLAASLNAFSGLADWKSSLHHHESNNRPELFHKRAAIGFVSYRPLDRGFKPIFTQSKRLMTAIASSLSYDDVVTSDIQLNGKWIKNAKLSDDTHALYEFVNLPWLLRKGERFFRYLELEKSDTEFRRTVNAGGFLNVSEVYPMNGDVKKLKRRDLRTGTMDGKVERLPEGLKTVVTWDEPYGLSMQETFCLSEDANQLTVYTKAIRPTTGKSLDMKQVFKRM